MSTTIVVILALGALGVGLLIGLLLQRKRTAAGGGSAETQGNQRVEAARQEAEALHRKAELEAKELIFAAKSQAEQESKRQLAELSSQHERLVKREESLEKKEDQLRTKEAELSRKEGDLGRREQAAEASARSSAELVAKASRRLEELAKLTPEQARDLLVQQMTDQAKVVAAAEIKRIEEETAREAQERATTVIATAIQRYASDYVSERTVSVVQLPNDEMKGRIIGREGRNIRALEAATGVDLIIDDTPEAVILSCFDPVRREVARIVLSKLISDGRIHPSRIEEVVRRATDEVNAGCKEAGEQAVFDLGLSRVHPELVLLLGQLKFRSSYAQNLLQHSVEVGYIAGVMAAELGVSVKHARRAGLLHDVGKAIDHEMEGSHAAVGAQLAKKYGESPKIAQAIAAHHGEVAPASVLDHLVDAANQLSAQRPGARRQRLQTYVQRLHDLEKLCKSYAGVEKAYAIQAGREVRVLVDPTQVSDEMAVLLSKDIARQVETEMTYPGQVRVFVLRETRATDTAR